MPITPKTGSLLHAESQFRPSTWNGISRKCRAEALEKAGNVMSAAIAVIRENRSNAA